MKHAHPSLYKISISITPKTENAVVELLAALFAQPPVVYTNLERQTTCASVYLERFGVKQRTALLAGLHALCRAGIDVGPARYSISRLPKANWAESWKRHFKPLEISDRLLVLPSWSKRRAKCGQVVVVLDPGLSFGTGHHPTTAFCLEQIASCREMNARQSFLDIGTGSGILAIAAAKLGYSPVVAFDFDPEAVRVAKENAAGNRVRIKLLRRDLTELPVQSKQRFTVVCANLISDLLIEQRRRILARVSGRGTLVLAGILKKEFPKVRRAYEMAGLYLIKSGGAKEWRSGAFCFKR